MASVYRSERARAEVRRWCENRIEGAGLARARSEVVTSAGVTGVVTVGPEPRGGGPTVVLLPGTNMNAALCLPVVEALARARRVVVLDLPGQPGLSADLRPRAKRSSWYGKWLAEALAQAVPGPVVVVGHSLGGAVSLACDAPQIVGRVLLSSAGLVRLRVPAPSWPPLSLGSCGPRSPVRRRWCAAWRLPGKGMWPITWGNGWIWSGAAAEPASLRPLFRPACSNCAAPCPRWSSRDSSTPFCPRAIWARPPGVGSARSSGWSRERDTFCWTSRRMAVLVAVREFCAARVAD